MYCKYCGQPIDDDSVFCNACGKRFDDSQSLHDDSSNIGFAILGFFLPIVGLVIFLIYESNRPKRAKSVMKGVLIGFITRIVLFIIFIVIYMVFMTSLYRSFIP